MKHGRSMEDPDIHATSMLRPCSPWVGTSSPGCANPRFMFKEIHLPGGRGSSPKVPLLVSWYPLGRVNLANIIQWLGPGLTSVTLSYKRSIKILVPLADSPAAPGSDVQIIDLRSTSAETPAQHANASTVVLPCNPCILKFNPCFLNVNPCILKHC